MLNYYGIIYLVHLLINAVGCIVFDYWMLSRFELVHIVDQTNIRLNLLVSSEKDLYYFEVDLIKEMHYLE